MPTPVQPNFVLGVETSELYIQAGLQDRVIQVCVCMPCVRLVLYSGISRGLPYLFLYGVPTTIISVLFCVIPMEVYVSLRLVSVPGV